MSRKITSQFLALAAIIGVSAVAACNTVEGVGQDVEKAGAQIEETARETNDGNPNTP